MGSSNPGKNENADKKANERSDNQNDLKKELKDIIEQNESQASALKKIETEKSAVEGKTFGDLLKEGKLPGSK